VKKEIPIAKPVLGKEELKAVKEVLESGMLVQGEKVECFEKKFAEYVDVEHAVAVTNGTVALDLALKALNIGPGDEVITSPFSFIASGNCILFQGAKPVFADIDPKTFNIDPEEVAKKITPKTRAVIAVHIFGQPARMDELKEITEEKGVFLVEDAAQAHGAEYKGQKTGAIGEIGCFSFYATKNMVTGEGGMVTTNDPEVAERVQLLRNHGQTRKYYHEALGYNYRMTEISAAIGLVQLQRLDEFNRKRWMNAKLLTDGIGRIDGLTPPYTDKDVKHVFHQYVIKVEKEYPKSRDELTELLAKEGIGTAVHYPLPIYRQPLYQKQGYKAAAYPNTEDACKKVLSLPVHPLVNKSDIHYILETLEEISRRR